MAVNLRGEFLCTREVLRQSMLEHDDGRLIFISSIAGRRGARHSCAYSASKWGILGLAHSVAQDLKETSIRVTAITPGRAETPMAWESEQWDPERGLAGPRRSRPRRRLLPAPGPRHRHPRIPPAPPGRVVTISRISHQWVRPRWSFYRRRAHAHSTRETTMLSLAGTRRRQKSGAILAPIGKICGT